MATNLPSREDLLNNLQLVNIANLPDSSTDNATCQICFGDLADNASPGESERAVLLHGSHYYGEDCIRHWLQSNDSCPMCRERVHEGNLRDDRLVIDLLTETTRMMQQWPTIESPIDDRKLFDLFGRLRRAQDTITSATVVDILEAASIRLLKWRREWWLENPAFLQTGEFTNYTVTRYLDAYSEDTVLVVRATQGSDLILTDLNDAYDQAIEDVSRDQSRHIVAHPLSFTMSRVLRHHLRAHNGEIMLMGLLGMQLEKAVMEDPRFHIRAVCLEHANPEAFRSLKAFIRDTVVHVVQDLAGPPSRWVRPG